ncbi:hypothetical protein K435DRAFT_459252 [Dendrothele bispora CBS 962.96]|uniref:Uncharacterized protein n=1 Tax=Dendrothele bispora (strain CBS 962.96) TaxID=1314807 RepID=A0A4S8MDG2_DENBC|nr:hypothetical protein K435DRAFT_459252 [Dendrothele bispora CBS 962.96]
MNSTPLPTPPQTPTKAVAPLLVDASPPSTPMSTDQMPILNQPDQESPPTALLNPKDLTCLTETTYIPLRRRFSGIGVIFCFVEALEGLELDEFCSTDATSSTPRDGERGNDVESGKGKEKERAGKREKEENDRDLEKMKELVGDIIGLAWDVFSFNIDQSIAFDPFNIVNVLVQCKHGRGVSGVTSGRGQGVSGTMVSPRSPGAGAGPAVGSESGIGAPGLGSKRGTGVGIGSLGAAIHQTGNIVKAKFEEYERVERGLVRRCGLGDVDGGENWDGHAGARMVGGKEEGSGVSSLLKRWLWGTGTSSKRGVGLGGLATNVYPQSSKNTNAKDVEEGPYTNSALTDLSLYLLGLKDCLVGSLNWAYETEMFFGTKGDSVRGYGWVFLLPRDEE